MGAPTAALQFKYHDLSFTAAFIGLEVTGEVLFQFSHEHWLRCVLNKGAPTGEGQYKPKDTTDEWHFKWTSIDTGQQIQKAVSIGDIARKAQHAIEGLRGGACL